MGHGGGDELTGWAEATQSALQRGYAGRQQSSRAWSSVPFSSLSAAHARRTTSAARKGRDACVWEEFFAGGSRKNYAVASG